MTAEANTEPRFRRIKSTGTYIFWHPCSVCGSRNAPFGYGVRLLKDQLGTWYCLEHKPKD